jgi:hypothetical protein
MNMPDSPESLNPKEKAALKLIGEDVAARDLFFKRVSDPKWFFPLLEEEYFAAHAAPGPEQGEQEGFYRIPYWNVLDYLEKVSLRSDYVNYEKIVLSLLQIIRDVSSRRDDNNKPIDNYHTWVSFATILFNLPCHLILSEVIDLIPTWVNTQFGTNFQGHELATKLLPKLVMANDADSQAKAEKLLSHLMAVRRNEVGTHFPDRFVLVVDAHSLLEVFVSEKSEEFRLALSPTCISIISKSLREILRQQRPLSREFDFNNSYFRLSMGWSTNHLVFVRIEEIASQSPVRSIEDWFSEAPYDSPKVLGSEEIETADFESSSALVGAVTSHLWGTTLIQRFIREVASQVIGEWHPCLSWDLSYIWFTSLIEFKRMAHDAEETFVMILRSVMLSKAKANAPELVSVVQSYLANEYPFAIFRRLAIFVLAKQYQNPAFSGIRKQLFEKWVSVWLYDIHYERELIYLLEENCEAMSPTELGILRSRIAAYTNEHSNNIQRAFWKQRWYAALKANREFEILYEEMRSITGTEERPGYFVESMQGPGKSPYTIEELIASSNRKFADALLEFKGTNKWDGPTINGLAQTIAQAAEAQPDEMVNRLNDLPDKRIPFIHIYHFLTGIETAWKNRKKFDWETLVAFLEDYFGQAGFWQDEYTRENDDWKANHLWIAGATSSLVREAAETTSGNEQFQWSFPSELNLRVKNLLLKLSRVMHEEDPTSDDPISALLNTSRGKVVMALESLSIKIKRESGNQAWDEEIRSEFDRLIQLLTIPLITLIGFRYISFRELDQAWLENHVASFKDLPEVIWVSFFCGYLSHISRPGTDLYQLMIPHYERALNANLEGRGIEGHLVAHLADEYIDDLLPPGASIFNRMVQQWKPSFIKELVTFFFVNRSPWEFALEHGTPQPESQSLEKFRTKAIGVWRLVEEHYAGKINGLSREDKELISHSALLISFLPRLNTENTQLLKFSSQFPADDFNSANLLKMLNHLKNRDPDNSTEVAQFLADVLNGIVTSNVFLTYPEEAIADIVDFICSKGDAQTRGIGLEICSRYKERGISFLDPIYHKHASI